jgi:adenylyl cyclase-associated protein
MRTCFQSSKLSFLIYRLEAATSRLEDMASSIPEQQPTVASNGVPSIAAAATPAPASNEQPGAPKQGTAPVLPAQIAAFDELVSGEVQAYVALSEKLGGLVAEQSASVVRAFAAERDFLVMSTKTKKPEMTTPEYMEMLKDLQATIGAVNDIRVANRGSPLENHLMTVSEGIVMLGWVTVTPKPAGFVTEALNAAQFYGNRVSKEYKDKYVVTATLREGS